MKLIKTHIRPFTEPQFYKWSVNTIIPYLSVKDLLSTYSCITLSPVEKVSLKILADYHNMKHKDNIDVKNHEEIQIRESPRPVVAQNWTRWFHSDL